MEKIEFVKNRLLAMKLKGLSLERVAVAANLSRRTLTNIMNGAGVHQETISNLYEYFKKGKK